MDDLVFNTSYESKVNSSSKKDIKQIIAESKRYLIQSFENKAETFDYDFLADEREFIFNKRIEIFSIMDQLDLNKQEVFIYDLPAKFEDLDLTELKELVESINHIFKIISISKSFENFNYNLDFSNGLNYKKIINDLLNLNLLTQLKFVDASLNCEYTILVYFLIVSGELNATQKEIDLLYTNSVEFYYNYTRSAKDLEIIKPKL